MENRFNLSTSSFCGNYVMNLREKYFMDWKAEDAPKVADTLISAISYYLSNMKKKTEKVGFALRDLKGVFKLGAFVEYHTNEDETMQDNWTYSFTFNEEDMAGINIIYDINSEHFSYIVRQQAHGLHGMMFTQDSYYYSMFLEVVDSIISFLDGNAKEDAVVELDMPGYFVASVAIENGEKVYSITPDGAMKRVIKDDAGL